MTHGYVSTAPPAGNVKIGYLHVETDREFGDRLRKTYPWYQGDVYHKGEELDIDVYLSLGMQRKLVEVFP